MIVSASETPSVLRFLYTPPRSGEILPGSVVHIAEYVFVFGHGVPSMDDDIKCHKKKRSIGLAHLMWVHVWVAQNRKAR